MVTLPEDEDGRAQEAKARTGQEVLAWINSLPAEERKRLEALVDASFTLRLKVSHFEMLQENDAHERRLAPKVKRAARQVKHLARELGKLRDLLLDIDRQRKGSPLARWLWYRSAEGQSAYAEALGDAAAGRTQKPLPAPWLAEPKGGPGVVVRILADALGGGISRQLDDEVDKLKARKGGRPRGVLFSAACRLLAAEGHGDPDIAEILLVSKIATGTQTEVQARVKVTLDRDAKAQAPLHPLAEAIDKLKKMDDERQREMLGPWATRRLGEPSSE